jgi:5-(carboxyamino)imidazole ribonucleotide mutase
LFLLTNAVIGVKGDRLVQAIVAVIMGSRTDWEVMKEACGVLDELGLGYEKSLVSAHRTPDWLFNFAETAAGRGIKVIIAGAGGAAHLPGMVAAKTILPVIGVPIPATHLQGLDSLLSIVQMPAGVPVATVAIGAGGAKNAALLAAQILALNDKVLRQKLELRRNEAARQVLEGGTQLF